MMSMIIGVIGVVGAYLIGSISSAILVCRIMKLPDPRTEGSHNPGATNVLRIGGKIPASLTLIGDVLKGFIPVLIIQFFTHDELIISLVLVAAIVGHVYPVFFKFQGGKGVATLIGGLGAFSPILCMIFLATWGVVFLLTRISSLSALIAVITMPIWAWILENHRALPALLFLVFFVIWRHRSNIELLLKGKEEKSQL